MEKETIVKLLNQHAQHLVSLQEQTAALTVSADDLTLEVYVLLLEQEQTITIIRQLLTVYAGNDVRLLDRLRGEFFKIDLEKLLCRLNIRFN